MKLILSEQRTRARCRGYRYEKAILLLVASLAGAITVQSQSTFTQITDTDLVTAPGHFPGGAWGDFRNTGFLDLITPSYGGTNGYFQNDGHGGFTQILQGDPVQDAGYHVAAAAGDYNNDGFLDVFVFAGIAAPSPTHNSLYRNNGNGTFTAVSGGTLTSQLGYFGPGAWCDYDRDGYLDLIVPNEGPDTTGGKNLLFHNNGDGTFKSVSGVIGNDLSVGVGLWQDYDNDGYDDLLVINRNGAPHFLYHNNQNGTFTKVANNISGNFDGAWGDYDNDGFPDILVGSDSSLHLYHNNGKGGFTSVTLAPAQNGNYVGCSFGDYDNDGYLDILVTGDHQANMLFQNNGDGTFSQTLAGQLGGGPGLQFNPVSFLDYDNDGFLDVFMDGSYSNDGSRRALLFHNDGNLNGWLEVKLTGTVANRSAIGAKVRVKATIGGNEFWQLREITGGAGFNAQPLVAHFGLGDAAIVETLRIEWPSGAVQEFQKVTPKQILTITEPPQLRLTTTSGESHFDLKAWPGMKYSLQSSDDLATWSPLKDITVTNMTGLAEIIDSQQSTSAHRFYRAVSR